jgi:hypothetical protein
MAGNSALFAKFPRFKRQLAKKCLINLQLIGS